MGTHKIFPVYSPLESAASSSDFGRTEKNLHSRHQPKDYRSFLCMGKYLLAGLIALYSAGCTYCVHEPYNRRVIIHESKKNEVPKKTETWDGRSNFEKNFDRFLDEEVDRAIDKMEEEYERDKLLEERKRLLKERDRLEKQKRQIPKKEGEVYCYINAKI